MEDYHIPYSATAACCQTHREFQPGETFYAVLIESAEGYARRDYSLEAWTGPPDEAVGYWMTKIPEKKDSTRQKVAVNDILLTVFDHLRHTGIQGEKLYILALLMIRRRIFRLEEEAELGRNISSLNVYCPRRDESYTVPVMIPDARRQAEIQAELAGLLTGADDKKILPPAGTSEIVDVDSLVLPEIDSELIIDN